MTKQKRRSPRVHTDADNPVLGYVATVTGRELWCAGEAVIVAQSEKQMRTYLAGHLAFSASAFRIAFVRLDTVLFGLRGGEVYAMARPVYTRLAPLAQQAGVRLVTQPLTVAAPAGERGPALSLVQVYLYP
jgi:hypothetical protein